jgi:hypothetical protein
MRTALAMLFCSSALLRGTPQPPPEVFRDAEQD